MVPIILFLVLASIQLLLIIEAHQVVRYAAFMAARTAVVYTGQHSHRIVPDEYNYQIVARYICAPISVRSTTDYPEILVEKFRMEMVKYIDVEDRRIFSDLVARLGYCFDSENMSVGIRPTESGSGLESIRRGEPVTVEILYKLPLVIPVVDKFFDISDRERDDKYNIVCHYTLAKERDLQKLAY